MPVQYTYEVFLSSKNLFMISLYNHMIKTPECSLPNILLKPSERWDLYVGVVAVILASRWSLKMPAWSLGYSGLSLPQVNFGQFF